MIWFWKKKKVEGCKECQERKWITSNIISHARAYLEHPEYKRAEQILRHLYWRKGTCYLGDMELALTSMGYMKTDFEIDLLVLNSYGLIVRLIPTDEIVLTPMGKEIITTIF